MLKERNNNNQRLSRFNVYIFNFLHKFKSLPFGEKPEVVTGSKGSTEARKGQDSMDLVEHLVPQLGHTQVM